MWDFLFCLQRRCSEYSYFDLLWRKSLTLMLKEKSWFSYRRFFKDCYSFDTIFRRETSTAQECSRSHRSEFQNISAVCLPFISGNIFLPMADDQTMFSFVVSKVQNEQGILCLVEVTLRTGCPVPIFPIFWAYSYFLLFLN